MKNRSRVDYIETKPQHIQPIQKYYNTIASTYDTTRFSTSYGKYIHSLEKRIYLKWAKKYRFDPNTFLDIGAGTGRWTEYASTGIDISFQMVKEARKKNTGLYVIADGSKLPFCDNSFSGIICMHTLMHNDKSKIETILREAKRVLKNGGWLLMDYRVLRRKKILRKYSPGWHGQTALHQKFFLQIPGCQFTFIDAAGVLLFPVHRLPKTVRPLFLPFEVLFSKWPFREFASYNMALLRIQK